jgi:hypothetical protein
MLQAVSRNTRRVLIITAIVLLLAVIGLALWESHPLITGSWAHTQHIAASWMHSTTKQQSYMFPRNVNPNMFRHG